MLFRTSHNKNFTQNPSYAYEPRLSFDFKQG